MERISYDSEWIQSTANGSNQVASYYENEVDSLGRILKPPDQIINYEYVPEDISIFISKWQNINLSSSKDWPWTTKIAWPDISTVVNLKRFDIYQSESPVSQQGTSNIEESRMIRNSENWRPIRSIFFLDTMVDMSIELLIESTGPPRRHRFRPKGKNNPRDLAKWVIKENLFAFVGAERIPGCSEFFVDYLDLPDRYFISSEREATLGRRRLFRFGAYSATQYYVLEKLVYHETLDSDGGCGLTYLIVPGPTIFARKDWKIIGSFYGFDNQLVGSSLYCIYSRQDPFPRQLIAMSPIDRPEEWDCSIKFYAFDVPIPGTSSYTVQHCLRSIHSVAATVPRHRLTKEDPRNPWEFRFIIYLFPAYLEDCSFTQDLQEEESITYFSKYETV
eukprot:gene11033-14814_t